jgi:hypothetical protein
MKRNGFVLFCLAGMLAVPGLLHSKDKKDKAAKPETSASAPVPSLNDQEKEEFLRTAKILRTRAVNKGVAGTQWASMTDGKLTHDGHVQFINEAKNEFKTDRGVELNFKDSYKFNIAAYRLGRMLGIENIPPYIERKVAGKSASISWRVDGVMMDEKARHAKKLEAPDPAKWNDQMYVVRVFDQLIYNVDRNLENLLILNNWDIVMIDHTRSFRLMKTLQNVKNLVKCDRTLLKNLRALDKDAVMKELQPWCTKPEMEAVMARRDLIVKFFDDQVKEKGEGAVLYDLPKAASAAASQ